jgi:hypothetical protein
MAVNTRPRAGERGAALFIVVLVIVLLTAIGVFAVHATSLAQAAAGYSRRAAAAFYLSEFAMNVVVGDMAGKETEYLQLASTGKNDCRATSGLAALLTTAGATGAIISCRGIEFDQMKQLMNANNPNIVSDADGPVFGALNRPDRPDDQIIQGSFRVEMTDVGPGPIPQAGMAMSGATLSNAWQTAFTTTARIAPQMADMCSADATRASESQSLRGYVVFTTLGPPPPGALPP